MQRKCSELEFGFIDAQAYLRNPNHPLSEFFRKSFYKSNHLERAVNPDVYFLLGEKGTGKTAYAVYATLFMKGEYNAACEYFDTNDFTRFVEISRNLGIAKSQYSSIWSLVFLLLLLEQLDVVGAVQSNSTLAPILEAARSVNLGSRVNSITKCLEVISEIDSLFASYAEAAGLKIPKHTLSGAKPIFKINSVTDNLAGGLSGLNGSLQHTIFIDGLDVRPEEVSYPDYLEVIASICNAIWVVNATQLAKLQPKLKLTLLLRPDIIEAISFQNRGPKIQHHGHLVEWSTDYRNYRTSEIFKFTDLVLFSQQDHSTPASPGDTWDAYFDFTVPSRVNPNGDNPFILFLRHSFYKPRDIIKYLTLMGDFYKEPPRSDLTSFKKEIFDERSITKDYSNYLLQEIRDQLSFYYTNAEYQQFLDFNNGYLGKFLDKHERTVSYADFISAHSEYLAYNHRNGIKTVPTFSTADQTLQFMFDLNVLGYTETKIMRDGGSRKFSNYSFVQRSFANLRPKVPSNGTYVMHYGVAKSLFVEMGR